jgi:hypothetical protein
MSELHESIVERLQRAKGFWRSVARWSGVPYSTLTEIAERQILTSSHAGTLEKLKVGLSEFERFRRKQRTLAREEMELEEFERLKQRIEARRRPKVNGGARTTSEGEGSAA